MADALARLMQHATGAPLRLEAAGWLGLFVQAAYLAQPEQVFVTLVTAAVHTSDPNEQRAYLAQLSAKLGGQGAAERAAEAVLEAIGVRREMAP